MTVTTGSPQTYTPTDLLTLIDDALARISVLEQQSAGISGAGGVVTTFPGGISVGSPAVAINTSITGLTTLTLAGSAYLSIGYIDASWTIPDTTVNSTEIFYALKSLSGGTYDTPRSLIVAGATTRIEGLICNRTYGCYVVSRNNLGIPSTPYPAPIGMVPSYQDVVIPADSTVPPAIAGIATNLGATSLITTWTAVASTELDVLDGGYYEVELDGTDNTFTHLLQDWRGAATVMSFDGLAPTAIVQGTINNEALPAITSIVANGTTWTYTFASAHGLSIGNTFKTVGFIPVLYNVTGQTVGTVPTSTTLTVTTEVQPGAVTTTGTSAYGVRSAAQTSINITGAGFPATSFVISVLSEDMLVTAGFGTTTWTVTRGVNGTTPLAEIPIGAQLTYGPASGNYWVRVRAVSVGGIPGAWTDANAGSPIVAGGISGVDILARTISAVSIIAGSITANEIAANTITAGNIMAGTITATQLAALQLSVGQYIRSSNYIPGSTGWDIDNGGFAEFGNITIRGNVNSSTITSSIIQSSTIIGSMIETASSGPRLVMETSISGISGPFGTAATPNLEFYSGGTGAGDATNPAYITGFVLGTYSAVALVAPGGTTGNPSFVSISGGVAGSGVVAKADYGNITLIAAGTNPSTGAIILEAENGISLVTSLSGGGTYGLVVEATGGVQINHGVTMFGGYDLNWSGGGGISVSTGNISTGSGSMACVNLSVASSVLGNLSATGSMNATAFNVVSDFDLKNSIIDISDSSLLHKLRPVSFRWNPTDSPTTIGPERQPEDGPEDSYPIISDDVLHYGLIAQEVKDVFPHLVVKHDLYGGGIHTINYTELIPLLVAEVQKLRSEVDILQGAH